MNICKLTDFTSDQLKLYIQAISKEKTDCWMHWALDQADDLKLFEVQLRNALEIVTQNEKIIQS